MCSSDLSLQDLVGFTEKFPFNARLIKNAKGQLGEHVPGPDGLYFRQITAIISHLTRAAAVAPANALRYD